MSRRLVVAVLAVMALGIFAASASADTQDIIQPQNETRDQGFQAGTCIVEGLPGPPPVPCSPETPTIFYTQAGGHPPIAFTQYIIEHEPFTPLPSPPFPPGALQAEIPGEDINDHTIKTLRVDVPPGLTVNPEATPRCPLAQFLSSPAPGAIVPTCDPATKVGKEKITLVTNRPGVEIAPGFVVPIAGFVIPPQPELTEVDVYNLEPAPGEPAKFGFVVRKAIPIFLETELAWHSDYHAAFTIKLPNTAEATGLSTLISRLVNFGRSGDGSYINNPTTCFNPNDPEFESLYSTWFRAESYGEPDPIFPEGSTPVEAKLPKDESGQRVQQTGCDAVPFDPALKADPGTNEVDAPAGATVTTEMPWETGGTSIAQSHLREAHVTLPRGMGLNPSAAKGLVGCTDAQFGKGTRKTENECPAASKVGVVEIQSALLPDPLTGDVYVGDQKSRDPKSGESFRILVEAKDLGHGVLVRLGGRIFPDLKTGQLTAEFTDPQRLVPISAKTPAINRFLPKGLPQVPFESFRLTFDGGPRAVLSSPPICGPVSATSEMEPWARPGTFESPSSAFTLTSMPGGGDCPKTMAERPFAPPADARVDDNRAGDYTTFRLSVVRPAGQQELKGVDITLPEGLTGKLAGIPYCSDAQIAIAKGHSAHTELGNPSCSSENQIGTAVTTAGTGPEPISIGGKVHLAGPYKNAPLSLVVITPALEGPYDLGTVVIQVPLHVDPRTTQVRAISDVIPDVHSGVKLDIRSVDVTLDRKQFMRNATNCGAKAITGTLFGGGAEPTVPATFSSFATSSPYQARDCKRLKFEPKLYTRLFAKNATTRAKHPKLRAVLVARKNDANIKRTAVTLPDSVILDQANIRTVCTRAQLATRSCPKAAIYGHARATTPLLDRRLKGPVYMVSSNNQLPDLVADLRGQVNVQLYGVISSKRGGIKTVFASPDVPVKKFILTMRGGKKRGLLFNTTNICRGKQFAFLNIKAHNGRRERVKRQPLKVSGCGNKGKKGGRR